MINLTVYLRLLSAVEAWSGMNRWFYLYMRNNKLCKKTIIYDTFPIVLKGLIFLGSVILHVCALSLNTTKVMRPLNLAFEITNLKVNNHIFCSQFKLNYSMSHILLYNRLR